MGNLQRLSNIILGTGIILLVLQVALIATFDKTNIAINTIDSALSKLSEQYVTYDNYVTSYKTPVALNKELKIKTPDIIYLNTKSVSYMSYDFRLRADK